MTASSRISHLACVGFFLFAVSIAGAQQKDAPVPTPPEPGVPEAKPAPSGDEPDSPPPARERRSRRILKDVFRSGEPGPSSRFPLVIDPKTPAKNLLPKPPNAKPQTHSAFVDDLAQVPELMLTDPCGKQPDANKELEAIAHQIMKINRLNAAKKDRFMEVLIAERPDLAGLPFVMGDACRMPLARSRHFTRSVGLVHQAMSAGDNTSAFLQNWSQQVLADDDNLGRVRQNMQDDVAPARVAAMMQICAPASENYRLAMAKYIGSVSREESTRALARIVLFTGEDEIRNAALNALAARKDRDYTDLLLQGLRYPWPAVGKRAAEALVKLDRKDVIPQLIDVLDELDPRAPVVKKADGKSVATVRELVRINHHRNCLMCHAPGQDVTSTRVLREKGDVGLSMSDVLVAEVPVPGQPLPSFQNGGYQSQGLPELLVRIDVTYLRQDFSALLAVADAAPWPEQQRFDFVTRTRVLSDEELKQYGKKLNGLEPGVLPPNHKAALSALRELTGKDAAPTAEAWRKMLNIKAEGKESASK